MCENCKKEALLYPYTEQDLRLDFKMQTGEKHELEYDVEEQDWFDTANPNYVKWLEEKILKQVQDEKNIELANIEANTIVYEEQEQCN